MPHSIFSAFRQAAWLRLSLSWIAFWSASQFVHSRRAAAEFTIELVRLADSNHPNVADLTEEFSSSASNPESFSDPNGAMLQPMLEHAVEQW
jgi:hypothetical protein